MSCGFVRGFAEDVRARLMTTDPGHLFELLRQPETCPTVPIGNLDQVFRGCAAVYRDLRKV